MTALFPILTRRRLATRPDHDFFGRFFEDFGLPRVVTEETEFAPAFDVSETEKEVIVRVEVPGMDKKDITINLTDDILTVKGEKKHEKEHGDENYHSVERRFGAFSRTMRIPVDVEVGKVDATYKDGVLKITLPKSERVKPKEIPIKS